MRRISGTAGFTYLGLLIAMTIIGIMVGVVGPSWRAASKVEKEKELIWRGHQFRNAIALYTNAVKPHMAANVVVGPTELDGLLDDPRGGVARTTNSRRFIRKIYTDPMTGKDDWVLVMDTSGHIKGVHSASDAEPLKTDNFDLVDSDFKGKTKYSEWIFEYKPGAPGQPLLTTGQPVAPGPPPTGQPPPTGH